MPTDLERFVAAQEGVYDRALAELRAGRKTSHWMWFVFPQIAGLGARLRECAGVLSGHSGLTAFDIFGGIDAMKLRSSMTLFWRASSEPLFRDVLERYFD